MADDPKPKVGYGHPPVEHRFRKGEPSPNPKGRPRKSKAFQEAVVAELNRRMTITEKGRRKKATIIEVTLRQLALKAASGDPVATRELIRLAQMVAPLEREDLGAADEARRRELAEKLLPVLDAGLEAMAYKPERPRPLPNPPDRWDKDET